MAKKDKTFSYEIESIHAYLNEEQNKVLATVSWNGRDPKLELRICWKDDDGELKLGKGLSLSKDEAAILVDVLSDKKLPSITKEGKKSVNFDNIFASSADIVEKREQGYTTEDGFMKLRKRPGVKLK